MVSTLESIGGSPATDIDGRCNVHLFVAGSTTTRLCDDVWVLKVYAAMNLLSGADFLVNGHSVLPTLGDAAQWMLDAPDEFTLDWYDMLVVLFSAPMTGA